MNPQNDDWFASRPRQILVPISELDTPVTTYRQSPHCAMQFLWKIIKRSISMDCVMSPDQDTRWSVVSMVPIWLVNNNEVVYQISLISHMSQSSCLRGWKIWSIWGIEIYEQGATSIMWLISYFQNRYRCIDNSTVMVPTAFRSLSIHFHHWLGIEIQLMFIMIAEQREAEWLSRSPVA